MNVDYVDNSSDIISLDENNSIKENERIIDFIQSVHDRESLIEVESELFGVELMENQIELLEAKRELYGKV